MSFPGFLGLSVIHNAFFLWENGIFEVELRQKCADWLKGVLFSALVRPGRGEDMSNLLAESLLWVGLIQNRRLQLMAPVTRFLSSSSRQKLFARPDSGQILDQ